MNERIKELIEQATEVRQPAPHSNQTENSIVFNKEKFAELIVKECASICEIEGRSYEYSFTPAKAKLAESTSNHCSKMIQKHFGVE